MNKSDVILINPPWIRSKGNIWQGISSCMPPLGIAYIASYLEQQGISAAIIDGQAERLLPEEIVKRVQESHPKYIGITATTALIFPAYKIAAALKAVCPDITIILGGVHPTVLPEEALAQPSVDGVVRGEGEQTLLEIIRGKSRETIDGLSYRANGQIRHNKERVLFADLNELPFPAYHLLPMKKYYPASGAYRRLPATSIMATRGCPGKCTFCYRIFGNRLRARSGRNVADEVKLLKERYGIREICFYDDTFTAVRRNVLEFCKIVQDEKLDISWSCFARVDFVNEEVLTAMKSAGCHQIMYGFESASPEILKAINKKVDIPKAEEAIRLTKKVGIANRAAFMFGNPEETIQTMHDTLNWVIRMNPEVVIFNIATPYPGTEMFTWAKQHGHLLTENWEDYDLSKPVMRLPTVSPEEVQQFYRFAYRKYYLRMSYIWGQLKRLRNMDELKGTWRAFISIIRLFVGGA
jgi:radical SAM superfamily enzyme YgiQ (UPF0313 family)